MPYIPPSVVQEVKQMDLLTYLRNYEPHELVHFSGNTYTTRTHDSLKISNGKWMWWSQRTGSSFIGEANESDKNYSFSIFTEKSCDMVHLFESAIDLLSYATLLKLDGKEWRREHLLSLAGVYQPAKEIEKSKVPATLARVLKMHPEVKTIVLHLDNDRIGRLATKSNFYSTSETISGKRCTAKTRKRL